MAKEQHEIALLQILEENQQPMGCSILSQMLKSRNYNVSSATVGRMLSDMDLRGLTVRQGYRGRALTELGQSKLKEHKVKQDFEEFGMAFYDTVNDTGKENLIEILVARRAIEREIARLAAVNATEEDLEAIRSALQLQKQSVKGGHYGRISSENDVLFHRAIARACKNRVLSAAYDFIWQNGRFSPIMEYVRVTVGGTIAVDHAKIYEAIAARDPELAQVKMVGHIDSLISDVNNYWSTRVKK